jgi:hypothetical protein
MGASRQPADKVKEPEIESFDLIVFYDYYEQKNNI